MHLRSATRLSSCLGAAAAGLPLLLLSAACAGPAGGIDGHEMLNATLWQQASPEYEAVALQSYRLARENLERALADPHWSAALEQHGDFTALPPAVILDLDETVLDNTPFEARIIREQGQFTPEDFAQWCEAASAPALAGVREFLGHAERLGVAVFYYSARKEALRTCTTRNLRRLGLPFAGDSHLLLNDGRGKSQYRAQLAAGYRILLLVGDSLEDFVSGSKAGPAARRELARTYAGRWGRQWIMLPNAMYGHWEATFYGFDYRMPRAGQLQHKREALQVPRGSSD